jgi:hypothetical protein
VVKTALIFAGVCSTRLLKNKFLPGKISRRSDLLIAGRVEGNAIQQLATSNWQLAQLKQTPDSVGEKSTSAWSCGE